MISENAKMSFLFRIENKKYPEEGYFLFFKN